MANTHEDAKLARDTVAASKQILQMGSQWLSCPYQHKVREIVRSGTKSVAIKSKVPQAGSSLAQSWQTFRADDYRGKRLRLSGYVKASNIADRAYLFVMIDGEQSRLAFDDMQDRPIKGTSDWKIYDIVLDVPENADGSWILGLEIVPTGNKLSGTATITFSNGEVFRFKILGRYSPKAGKTTLLSLILADNPQAYTNDIRLFGKKIGHRNGGNATTSANSPQEASGGNTR